jgi:hypothetical protein
MLKQVEHWVPHAPQWFTFVFRSTHAPLQLVIPPGQEQVPPEQVPPVGQGVPHWPQLAALV